MQKDLNQVPSISRGDELRTLYGLTPAEIRLALAFQSKASITAAAASEGLTSGTARQYMKRIFKKTSTSNQAQLMKILLTTVKVA